ncbi:MAG: thioesterase family protein [Candidatus Omnitrophica bacterium]|nr:thioesterase family protein [Candidatus Omnitrophota bacterium]MDD5592736.1 thioesterase family protein [Candidatus Omnitrophota bacterium]
MHHAKVKIYYHDTDCGGVVYYANYLKFLEEARTEFFAERDVSVKELTRQGILFVVARQEIDYKSPAFYGDTLDIETRLTNISRVKLEFEYEIKNQDGQLISCAKTIMVCVDKNLKPQAIPEEMRKKLSE